MQLIIGGTDVTDLTVSVTTSGSSKECARTLKAEILQSPTDSNIPSVDLSLGGSVYMSSDGQTFSGSVTSVSRTTNSAKITVTAKDKGIYIKNNKISCKVKNQTAEQAALTICSEYGIETGSLASTGYTFSRNFTNVSIYEAVMTGYALASADNGKKYYAYFSGDKLNIAEKTENIVAVIAESENLMQATYSETTDGMVNQVDILDSKGNLVQSVMGDTSYGIIGREQLTLSKNEDTVAKAEQTIREKGVTRKGTVQNLGDADCITGAAVMVQETFSGLYGQFWISDDTHTWKNGIYTNKLTLEWEATMTAKAAGEAVKEVSKKKKKTTTTETTTSVYKFNPDGSEHK